MAWWYNDSSGALTSAGSIQSFFQQLQGDVGLGAGWHHLKIADNATGAQAAAEAKKEFPNGTPPTTSVSTQVANEAQNVTGVTNPLSGLEGVAKIFGDFFSALTDGKMWRSLGWILLGVFLLFLGIRLWYGESLGQAATALPGLPGRILRAA